MQDKVQEERGRPAVYEAYCPKILPPVINKQENYLHQQRKNHQDQVRIMHKAEEKGNQQEHRNFMPRQPFHILQIPADDTNKHELLYNSPGRVKQKNRYYMNVENTNAQIHSVKPCENNDDAQEGQ